MRTTFIRSVLTLSLIIAISCKVNAQGLSANFIEPRGWSLGMTAGLSDLWGDVGTKSILDHYTNSKYSSSTHYMGGVYGRYTFHPAFSVRLQLEYGSLYATDAWNYDAAKKATTIGDDAFQRYARYQDIKDNIWEPSILFEIVPRRFNPESRGAHHAAQPYVLLGISYFHFQPYSTLYQRGGGHSEFVKIYDLHLEGDGFGAGYPPKYSLWQMAIPLGIGYRFDIGKHLNLGIEYCYRLTFTDYLDGVSGHYIDPSAYGEHLSATQAVQAAAMADKSWVKGYVPPHGTSDLRGNPSNKDSYSTISINFYYKVKSHTAEWWY